MIISRVDPNYAQGAPVAWWMKIAAKIVLSRLPVDIRRFQKIGIFVNSSRIKTLYRNINQLLRRFVSVFFTLGRRRLSEWFDYAL